MNTTGMNTAGLMRAAKNCVAFERTSRAVHGSQ